MSKCLDNKDKFHYDICGLDNIYLANGYEVFETDEDSGISIVDVYGLHKAIAVHLCGLGRSLTGKEFRFLRIELDLSQRALGLCFDKEDQTIANWEKGNTPVPRESDILLRNLYMESINENPRVSDLINQINEIDRAMQENETICFEERDKHWTRAA